MPVRTCRVSVCVVGPELMALEEKKKSIICLHAGLGLGFAVPIVMNDTQLKSSFVQLVMLFSVLEWLWLL